MTVRLLDVSKMPFDRVYTCNDGFEINLPHLLDKHRPVVQALADAHLVKRNDSFGFAMMKPLTDDYDPGDQETDDLLDKPEEFVYFVGGWGPKRDYYIANAIRKIRPLLGQGMDLSTARAEELVSTLDLRLRNPDAFQDPVRKVNEDGTFPWGDFPWGGGVVMEFGDVALIGAVSALSEVEDDIAARLILGSIGKLIIEHNQLLPAA